MKRIILTLLIFFALCITAQADEQNSTVRVGLMYGSSAQSSVTVSGSGMQYGTVTGAFAPSGSFQSDSVTLTVADANTLTDGTNVFDVSSGTFALMPANGFFTLNGKQYRGCVLLKIQSDGNITVINCLTLDEYLYGVIGSEMPSAWNIEALKAQAVCARGFTLTNMNKHADYGFNVCATTNCQVYGGVAAETESTRRAVNETSGKALQIQRRVRTDRFLFLQRRPYRRRAQRLGRRHTVSLRRGRPVRKLRGTQAHLGGNAHKRGHSLRTCKGKR